MHLCTPCCSGLGLMQAGARCPGTRPMLHTPWPQETWCPTTGHEGWMGFLARTRIPRPGGDSAGDVPPANTLGQGSRAGARTPGSSAGLPQLRRPLSAALQGGGNGRGSQSSALWYPLFARGVLTHLPLSGAGAEGTKTCHYPAQGSLPVPRASPLPR